VLDLFQEQSANVLTCKGGINAIDILAAFQNQRFIVPEGKPTKDRLIDLIPVPADDGVGVAILTRLELGHQSILRLCAKRV
jgi:hypothetical protein